MGKLRLSLPFRLTVWYAVVFAVTSGLALAFLYAMLVSTVRERTDKDMRADAAEFALFVKEGGLERVRREIRLEAQSEGEDVFFRLWTGDGDLIMAAVPGQDTGRRDPPDRRVFASLTARDTPVFRTVQGGAIPERRMYAFIAPGIVLEMGESLADDQAFIQLFLGWVLVALAGVMVLGAPVGWFMARRALAPVEAVTRTAGQIASGALDRRVEVRSSGDELDMLARTFNTMLDRIQSLLRGTREMTDTLAHDLRSPVGRIRAAAEAALWDLPADEERCRALATGTIEECDRLLEMINANLDIAEANAGATRLTLTDVDMVALVGEACELYQTVADDRGIRLEASLPEACNLSGDRQRLQRVVANLIDNALKYTPPGGRVRVALDDEAGQVCIVVADTGVGILPADVGRVFERFYRGDPSRSGRGNGLGLSVARALARAHGGEVTVASVVGEGSEFTVTLPKMTGAPRIPATIGPQDSA